MNGTASQRMLRILAAWFVVEDEAGRARLTKRLVELKGELKLDIAGRDFVLSGRADRFDMTDTGLRIVDYKTGTAPGKDEVLSGLNPQLPLEAAMVMEGGFGPELARIVPTELTYIELKGRTTAGAVKTIVPKNGSVAELANETLVSLISLLARFNAPEQAYHVKPRAKFKSKTTDYDHLSRWPEWGRLGGGE